MNPQTKSLLLFAAKLGYQTRSFETAARKMNADIIYVTDRCHQLHDPWGDRAIPVSFHQPEVAAHSVVEALRGQRVDGTLALGDRPAVTAAYAARGLGVSFHHPLAVEACRSKLRTREVLRDAGMKVPWFRKIPLHPAPEPALLGMQYPCVLKPLSLSASQGVVRANNRSEFMEAVVRIRRLLDSPEVQVTREANLDQLLVEGYIAGREVAVEGLLTQGDLRVLAIFDKPDPLEGPFFEETIYVTPSRLSDDQQESVKKCAREAAAALGLSHGPIHAEFRINEDGVWPLEVAARPIGGLCGGALRFGASENAERISLEELLLRHALELPGAEWSRERKAAGVMMIPVPSSGVYGGVEGKDAARTVSGVTDVIITARLQDYVAAWPEGASYLGFLFSRGATAEEAEQSLRQAHATMKFKLTPRLPVDHPMRARF